MPTQHRGGRDDLHGSPPLWPDGREQHPEQPIDRTEARFPCGAVQHRKADALPRNVGNGASADVVIQIGERALNPGIAPRAVLGRHPDDPLANLRGGARPSRAAAQVAFALAGDQRPMPREQGVRCHDGPDLRQRPSTECFGFRGQAPSLIVAEPEPPRSELLAQHVVLLLQIVDDVALLLVDPAGHRDKKKPTRMPEQNHAPQGIRAPERPFFEPNTLNSGHPLLRRCGVAGPDRIVGHHGITAFVESENPGPCRAVSVAPIRLLDTTASSGIAVGRGRRRESSFVSLAVALSWALSHADGGVRGVRDACRRHLRGREVSTD
jgi:hypothetical protein